MTKIKIKDFGYDAYCNLDKELHHSHEWNESKREWAVMFGNYGVSHTDLDTACRQAILCYYTANNLQVPWGEEPNFDEWGLEHICDYVYKYADAVKITYCSPDNAILKGLSPKACGLIIYLSNDKFVLGIGELIKPPTKENWIEAAKFIFEKLSEGS